MKKGLLLLFVILIKNLSAQYQGPIPPITSGYGANGTSAVAVDTLINDDWALHNICVFYPTVITGPVPTVFYAHGFGANDTSYQVETLRHLASKGCAVVFVPYKFTGGSIIDRYTTLYDGFIKAARSLPSIIDTTRIGFFGHSLGSGAIPEISYRLFTENNWGTHGRFIYCSAPWYSFTFGPTPLATALSNFPADCKMLTVLYNNDVTNDHRMGMDIFTHIAINDSIKDCITVYSDSVSGYYYKADHHMPVQYTGAGEFDALDYYVTNRLMDALADYTFTGSRAGKNVALGNGSPAQINMGLLAPLVVTDAPVPLYPESIYSYICNVPINEREAFCPDMVTTGIAEAAADNDFTVYPNPATDIINIAPAQNTTDFTVSVYNMMGELVLTSRNQKMLDLTGNPAGVYFISIQTANRLIRKKIILNK